MDQHPEAGGLGVKMVDGKGRFLPESKRGLPTPATAFYKIFGVSRIFIKSKKFNHYHLGHLSNNEIHEIEILSGAFMLMRKKALDEVGLLDESFFMYGEDIDLSWRIVLGGWKNYYFPETTIIHYKGESTKKGSLNYVFVFYQAMIIFAKKHFSEKNARLFSVLIHLAIYLRALAAICYRFFSALFLPFLDCVITLIFWYLFKEFYAESRHKIYDQHLLLTAFFSSISIWMLGSWLSGGYEKPYKPLGVVKPLLWATATILIVYSLLPETMRFSRALILAGGLIALSVFVLNRIIINFISRGESGLMKSLARRFAIIGNQAEYERVRSIIVQSQPMHAFFIQIDTVADELNRMEEIVRVHKIDQVIFCAKDISAHDIIATMGKIKSNPEFKIAPPETLFIIGSNSIETSGEVMMLDVNSVSKSVNQRKKRILDIVVCFKLIILSPVMILFQKNPSGYFANIISVLVGRKNWVGPDTNLLAIRSNFSKPSVIHPSDEAEIKGVSKENREKLNIIYSKDYHWRNDIILMLRNWRQMGGAKRERG
jgi:GT2 family glycosyltransferase